VAGKNDTHPASSETFGAATLHAVLKLTFTPAGARLATALPANAKLADRYKRQSRTLRPLQRGLRWANPKVVIGFAPALWVLSHLNSQLNDKRPAPYLIAAPPPLSETRRQQWPATITSIPFSTGVR
jgi:hypothetical protein